MAHTQENLFFDFDDMKFKTVESLVSYINNLYSINSVRTDYVNMNDHIHEIIKRYIPNIKISFDEVYQDLGKNFHASLEHQSQIEPMDDMKEVMNLLSKKYVLWTVTARQTVGLHTIEHLLSKHIPGCVNGIHCVWKNLDSGKFEERPKVAFINSVPGKKVAFFDDSPNEIRLAQPHIDSYLFDPHNIHPNSKGIVNRIFSWKEIGEKFL